MKYNDPKIDDILICKKSIIDNGDFETYTVGKKYQIVGKRNIDNGEGYRNTHIYVTYNVNNGGYYAFTQNQSLISDKYLYEYFFTIEEYRELLINKILVDDTKKSYTITN